MGSNSLFWAKDFIRGVVEEILFAVDEEKGWEGDDGVGWRK